MTVKRTGASSVKLKKPSHIIGTVWNEGDVDAPSGDVFIFEEVERGSTSITQDDPEEQTIDNEVSDNPIDTIVTQGSYKVSTMLTDLQKDLLMSMCGFFEDNKGGVCAPAGYKDRYIQLDIVYPKGEGHTALRVPKVKLASKVIIESLNEKIGSINLSGTAKDVTVTAKDGSTKVRTSFMMLPTYTLPSED